MLLGGLLFNSRTIHGYKDQQSTPIEHSTVRIIRKLEFKIGRYSNIKKKEKSKKER